MKLRSYDPHYLPETFCGRGFATGNKKNRRRITFKNVISFLVGVYETDGRYYTFMAILGAILGIVALFLFT